MNVLDENIIESQRQLLRSWRIRVKQIGHEIGRQGMKDDEVLPLLQRTRRVTLFTRDFGFYQARNCSPNYCVISLVVGQQEVAVFVRDILRHPQLDTQAKRMGKVIRANQTGIPDLEDIGRARDPPRLGVVVNLLPRSSAYLWSCCRPWS